MSIISADSLQTTLHHGKIEPLYFLFGDEELLIEESLQAITSVAVDESTRSFNYDILHGTECSPNDVVERASAYPLMADRRVVVVKEIDRMLSTRGKGNASSPLTRYMSSPSPTTTLVMTANSSKFLTKGKAKKPAKAPYDAIVENAASIHFKKLYDRQLPSWTADRIKKRGKSITPEAVELFVSYVGSSLRIINNEIEKLFTFVEDRKKITIDDIRSVVGTSKTFNVFELQKAIGTKNLELVVEIAERMLHAGEPVQLIITMLSRYFTILWRLSEVRTKTRDTREMARSVGISSFFINEYLAALGKYPVPHIRNAFEVLLRADIIMKSSSLSASLVAQMMLISIIQGENHMDFATRAA